MEFTVLIEKIDGWVWGYFLMFMLVGTGIFLTLRLRFVQFRHFRHGWSLVSGRWDDKQSGKQGP